jgi:Zn-dependent M28 family amino/carboxypeptidase
MKITILLLFITSSLCIAGSFPVQGQSIEEALKTINENSLKGQLNFLASDWMEGRESETKGAYLAGDYIASMFQVFGIEPFGDMEYTFSHVLQRRMQPEAKPSFFQKFNIIKYKLSDKQSFSLIRDVDGAIQTKNFDFEIDYNISDIETDTEINAPVVFVGYGIKNDSLKYSDFARVNVKGKIILRLDGFPGFRDTTSASYKKLKFSNLWKDKEKWAIESGAVGVITLSSYPNKDFGKARNLPFRYQNGEIEANLIPEKYYDKKAVLANDSIHHSLPVIRISARLQNKITSAISVDLITFEQDAKSNLKSFSKEIDGLKVGLKSGVVSELMAVRNVLGIIEGVNKNEFIIVGAHYDHIGKYGEYIFNGADDNGSGTVGMLSIARALKATGKKPEKTIVFAAWTAEEKGLLGSEYFVKSFNGFHRIALNLNFDMIGRSTPKDTLGNKCGINYTKAYDGFKELSQKHIKDFHLNLDVKYTGSEKPSGGSDYAPFAEKDVPVICFMAAMHEDYHKPSDEVSKIEWKKMENIIKLGFLNVNELANSDLKKYKLETK